MNELLLPSPETEMKHRRCDNKYFIWLAITLLGLGLFITGFRYSGHKEEKSAFLNRHRPSLNDSGYPTQAGSTGPSYELDSMSEGDSEGESEGDSEGDSEERYENPATEYGVTSHQIIQDMTEKSYVLILTEGRAGSTWLSSFFWNTPDTFYVYEPLHYTPALHGHHCHDRYINLLFYII